MFNLNKSSSKITYLDNDQDPPVGIEIELCLHILTVAAFITVSNPNRMSGVNVFKIISALHHQFFIVPFSSFLHDSESVGNFCLLLLVVCCLPLAARREDDFYCSFTQLYLSCLLMCRQTIYESVPAKVM